MLADRNDTAVKMTPIYYIYSYIGISQCRLTESQALGVVTSCPLSIAHNSICTSGYLVFASPPIRLKNNGLPLTLDPRNTTRL